MMVPVFVRAHNFHVYHFGPKYKDRLGRTMNTKPSLHFGPRLVLQQFQKTKHSIALVAIYIYLSKPHAAETEHPKKQWVSDIMLTKETP